MGSGRRYTVNGRRLTVNGKQLTVLIVSSILLISFVTVAIATGFFGTNTTKVSSLEKGLVAHYPLDGVYQTKDVTPYSNHGTNYGATLTTGVKDEPNGAYSFVNTQNDRIYINKDLIGTEDVTTSAWFYAYGVGEEGAGRIVSTERFWIAVTSNKGFYGSSRGGAPMPQTGANSFQLNTWNHIILTRTSAGIMNFYLNGVLIGTPNQDSGTPISGTTTLIGNQPSLDRDFDGKIADVKIYNRILNEDEIKLLYESYKPKASASDLNKGLVGHWMLDAENGAKDLTPYGNHGTAQGGITIGGAEDRKGKSGGATSFDGVDDYILVPDNDILDITDEITISAWVNLDTSSSSKAIVSKIDSSGLGSYGLWSRSAQVEIILKPLDTTWKAAPATKLLNVNEWYHIVGTYDGQKMKIYLNTQLSGELTETRPIESSAKNLLFGAINPSHYLQGKIQDVRIYNRALSEDEIKLLYDSYKPKEASVGNLNKGLVLDMPLTTKWMKSGTIVSDRTPYGNDGIVVGATVGQDSTSFDGVTNRVNTPTITRSFSEVSVSIWIKANKLGTLEDIVRNYPSLTFWILKRADNKFEFYSGSTTSTTAATSTTVVELNKWYHIVGMANGTSTKIYINGVYEGTAPVSQPVGNSSNPILISTGWEAQRYFEGSLSNFRIYNRVLSDEEVKLLYEKGRW